MPISIESSQAGGDSAERKDAPGSAPADAAAIDDPGLQSLLFSRDELSERTWQLMEARVLGALHTQCPKPSPVAGNQMKPFKAFVTRFQKGLADLRGGVSNVFTGTDLTPAAIAAAVRAKVSALQQDIRIYVEQLTVTDENRPVMEAIQAAATALDAPFNESDLGDDPFLVALEAIPGSIRLDIAQFFTEEQPAVKPQLQEKSALHEPRGTARIMKQDVETVIEPISNKQKPSQSDHAVSDARRPRAIDGGLPDRIKNQKKSITKEEIIDLLEQEYFSITDVQDSVGSEELRTILLAGFKNCRGTINRSSYGDLAFLSKLCIAKSIRIASLDVNSETKRMLNEGKTVPGQGQKSDFDELGISRSIELRMQKVFAILQKRLGILTVDRDDFCGKLKKLAQGIDKMVCIRVVPQDASQSIVPACNAIALFHRQICESMPERVDALQARQLCQSMVNGYAAQSLIVRRADPEAAQGFLQGMAGLEERLEGLVLREFPHHTLAEKQSPTIDKADIINQFLQAAERVSERALQESLIDASGKKNVKEAFQKILDDVIDPCEEVIKADDYGSLATLIISVFQMQYAIAVLEAQLPDDTKQGLLTQLPDDTKQSLLGIFFGVERDALEKRRSLLVIYGDEVENIVIGIQNRLRMQVVPLSTLQKYVEALFPFLKNFEAAAHQPSFTVHPERQPEFRKWLTSLPVLRHLAEELSSFLPRQIDERLVREYSKCLKSLFEEAFGKRQALHTGTMDYHDALGKMAAAIDEVIDVLPWKTAGGTEEEEEVDLSFGLDGEGPFSRDKLKFAFMIQTSSMEREGLVTSKWRQTVQESIDELCPEEIKNLKDLRGLIHWLAGHVVGTSIQKSTMDEGIGGMQQSEPLFRFYGPILKHIGERFGRENFGLTPDCVRSLAVRSDRVIPRERIQQCIEEAFSDRRLRKPIEDVSNRLNAAMRTPLKQHFQAVRQVMPALLARWLPDGVASTEEVLLLRVSLHVAVGNAAPYFQEHVHPFPQKEFEDFVTAVMQRWEPISNEFQDTVAPPLEKLSEQPPEKSVPDTSLWSADTTLDHELPSGLEQALVSSSLLSGDVLSSQVRQIVKAVMNDVTVVKSLGITPQTKGTQLVPKLQAFKKVALAVVQHVAEAGPVQTLEQYRLLIGGFGAAISNIHATDEIGTGLRAHLSDGLKTWFQQIEAQIVSEQAITVGSVGALSDSMTPDSAQDPSSPSIIGRQADASPSSPPPSNEMHDLFAVYDVDPRQIADGVAQAAGDHLGRVTAHVLHNHGSALNETDFECTAKTLRAHIERTIASVRTAIATVPFETLGAGHITSVLHAAFDSFLPEDSGLSPVIASAVRAAFDEQRALIPIGTDAVQVIEHVMEGATQGMQALEGAVAMVRSAREQERLRKHDERLGQLETQGTAHLDGLTALYTSLIERARNALTEAERASALEELHRLQSFLHTIAGMYGSTSATPAMDSTSSRQ